MRTEDLLVRIAADPPQPPLRPGRMLAQTAAAMAGCCLLFLAVMGTRDGLGTALSQPLVAVKSLLPLLVCLACLPAALHGARPEARPARPWVPLALAGAAGALWLASYALRPPGARFADVSVPAVAECLGFILALAALPLSLAIALLRRGAPTRPRAAGALAGLAVAAGVAAGYSLYCTQDNPLFYLTWYGAAIGLAAAVGALAGDRWLRW
ncbi:NrsF family protein [Frigidibacter oleivorans]|uniref:NrsF family protein n=1 Tax=Frigidibacter oleivorans TaxID=2487129 RepID=UPI000F8F4E2D|nr:NrsF family protein [Frigidibacter oleivorans]